MKILELYSGIGGMHFALKESGIPGDITAAIDINTTANEVYRHNFPTTQLLNKNIQGLTASSLKKLNVDTILMSPPCQPFTRNGLQRDVADTRTDSFMHVLEVLPQLNVEYILMENVKGFEDSVMNSKFRKALDECGFHYQEFILSPTQIGIPNSRLRYYCLARRRKKFEFSNRLVYDLPCVKASTKCIGDYISADNTEQYLIPDDILQKHCQILDICYKDSTRSCCFTKAYGRYVKGTGSVFCDKTQQDVDVVYSQIKAFPPDYEGYIRRLRSLNLRFFTPAEIARLMCFPSTFGFPCAVTSLQRYQLLGNSINVRVVAELLKILVNC